MIKIWHPPHVAFAAAILRRQLHQMGYAVRFVQRVDPSDSSLYIIYNAAKVKEVPPNYIVYQTEVPGSHWFTPQYLARIAGALAVWEYDSGNLASYRHLNPNVFVVSPGIAPQPVGVKDIPVLFYGYIKNSPVREPLLREIAASISVVVVTNKLRDDIWRVLARTRTVLNLHYYEQAPLETFRINESLSFGCNVVSQSSPDGTDRYKSLVRFADPAKGLVAALRESVQCPAPTDLHHLDNREELARAIECSANPRLVPKRRVWRWRKSLTG